MLLKDFFTFITFIAVMLGVSFKVPQLVTHRALGQGFFPGVNKINWVRLGASDLSPF